MLIMEAHNDNVWDGQLGGRTKLGDDEMEEILSRLPPKSIGIFRSVSKAWNALLSSRNFIRKHCSKRTSYSDSKTFLSFLVHTTRWLVPHDFHSLLVDNSNDRAIFERIQYPLTRCGIVVKSQILGSINGLVCHTLTPEFAEFVLLNPCIRTLCSVRRPNLLCKADGSRYSVITAGFAHDADTDSYKIIRLLFEEKGSSVVNVEVYCTRTDMWTTWEVDGFPCIDKIDVSLVVKGIPYWLIWLFKQTETSILLEFEPSTNQFLFSDLPAHTDASRFCLKAIGDQLALVHPTFAWTPNDDYEGYVLSSVHIRKLSDIGGPGSENRFTVEEWSAAELLEANHEGCFTLLLGFGRQGDMLVETRDGNKILLVCDAGITRTLARYEPPGTVKIYYYVPTLIWPRLGGVQF